MRCRRGCPEPVGDGQPHSSKLSPGFAGAFLLACPRHDHDKRAHASASRDNLQTIRPNLIATFSPGCMIERYAATWPTNAQRIRLSTRFGIPEASSSQRTLMRRVIGSRPARRAERAQSIPPRMFILMKHNTRHHCTPRILFGSCSTRSSFSTSRSRGVLDAPLSRGMTALCGAAPSPSFRDGPKDQTSDVQLHIGESLDSGFDASHRPGMTTRKGMSRQLKIESVAFHLTKACQPPNCQPG